MPLHYDIVVAGAGPGGSKTAWELAKAGAKVLLIEEHSKIGTPVHCSGLITRRTLNVAGIGNWVIQHEITGSLVYSSKGASARLGDDRVRAVVIDRPALDVWLAQQAQSHGADLWLSCRLETVQYERGKVRIGVATRRGRQSISATLLVGADGAGSRVARFLGQHTNSDRVSALGATIALPRQEDNSYVRVFVGEDIAPGWFGWAIPAGNGLAKIGVGSLMSAKVSQRKLLQQLITRFPNEFRGARFLQFSGGTIPLYRPIRTYGDNVLLVGDAARQVKPLSGGGIRTALLGAVCCAQTALEAMDKNDFSAGFLRRYEERCRAEMGEELELARNLRRLAYHLTDAQRHNLIHLLGHPVLSRLLNRKGDIDFPGRLFSLLVRQRNIREALLGIIPLNAAMPQERTTFVLD